VQTHWSRELFPKHFPEWRPPAQWSRLVGRWAYWFQVIVAVTMMIKRQAGR